jgi:hypothetical protein
VSKFEYTMKFVFCYIHIDKSISFPSHIPILQAQPRARVILPQPRRYLAPELLFPSTNPIVVYDEAAKLSAN